MKFDWKNMNGIQLFTKEWFVILVSLSFIFATVMGLIADGFL